MATEKQTCFVISPIGQDSSETRKRADQILKHVVRPAATACGFNAVRADEISEPGLITTQVLQHIIEDPLVIADLSGSNPNVFYELAVRHAIRKPLVQIIQKDEKIPFDVAGMRTIPVDHRDLDSVQEAKTEIEKQVNTILKKRPEEIESPISVSIELQALRHSENPEERSFAEFVSAVADLRSDIAAMDKRLAKPDSIISSQNIEALAEILSRRILRERPDVDRDYMKMREMMHMIDRTMHRIDELQRTKRPEDLATMLNELKSIQDIMKTMTINFMETREFRR
ncbi:hypothetical+protein [Methylocapsa aurea]|uniref:hypothetical protein n=1 Tax=Methylocapsa aurea TaxID=663610 RepID=UPI003D188CDC